MKLFKKSFTVFFLLATCFASLTWALSSGSFSSFAAPITHKAETEKLSGQSLKVNILTPDK